MICVECNNASVKRAFSKYKNDYIKLEVCANCHKLVDKYIEYDNVLLFLDIILLKPQAYRHLCFNVTEAVMIQNGINAGSNSDKDKTETSTSTSTSSVGTFLWCYAKLARVFVMMVLFEVYLLWAYEEKNTHHTLIMSYILAQPTWLQYVIFIAKTVVAHLAFNVPLQLILFCVSGWSSVPNLNIPQQFQKPYYSVVLVTDILVANSIKLVPILMLIWPYDQTLKSSKIVSVIAMLNVIESLNIITSISYGRIVVVYGACMAIQEAVSVGILACLVSAHSQYGIGTLISDHYGLTSAKLWEW